MAAKKRNLGLDHRFADRLHGFAVAAKVETQVAANIVERDRDQQVVDVVAAEVGIAVGGDDFEDAVMQLQNRNIEGAAAQIVDGDDAVLLFIETVGQRRGGRFVDQAQALQARRCGRRLSWPGAARR